jgi:two-component system NtrC family sensor kinase
MTLRQKTVLIIGVTLLCLLMTLYFSLSTIWLNGLADIESQQIDLDVERVTAALANDLKELNRTTSNWAAWEQTQVFVRDVNTRYIRENLNEGSFVNFRINMMLFINTQGRIAYGKGFDLEKKTAVPIPDSLRQYLASHSRLLQHSTPDSSYTGIVLLPEAPLLVASRPILKNNHTEPIGGTLLFGRFLNAAEVARLSELTRLPLAVYPFEQTKLPTDFQAVKDEFTKVLSDADNQTTTFVYPLSRDRMAGYTLLRDIEGKPGLLLRLDVPRDIYWQGKQALHYLGGALFLVGLVFAIVSLCFLEIFVFSPLARLSKAVKRIRIEDNLSERVITRGKDELSRLGNAINQLLVSLQQSQLQLCQSEVRERVKAQALEQTLRELTQTQAQLIHSEKLSTLGQLIAGVAHEINNPISSVYGNIHHASDYIQDLLVLIERYQQQYPNPPVDIQEEIEAIDLNFLLDDLPKLLDSMKMGTERICEIVQSMRTFSRMDEAKMKAVDIHEGIESTLLILKHQMKAKGEYAAIELMKEYGHLPWVECYAGQLNQVVMNLIVNAIDALEERRINKTRNPSQPSPCIWIRTEVKQTDASSAENPASSVVIRIADNGTGMIQEVRNHLFDPFFTTKPTGKGTGLGLSISYRIVVEKHKGKLLVKSEPGQGSEFIIELPIQSRSN